MHMSTHGFTPGSGECELLMKIFHFCYNISNINAKMGGRQLGGQLNRWVKRYTDKDLFDASCVLILFPHTKETDHRLHIGCPSYGSLNNSSSHK